MVQSYYVVNNVDEGDLSKLNVPEKKYIVPSRTHYQDYWYKTLIRVKDNKYVFNSVSGKYDLVKND